MNSSMQQALAKPKQIDTDVAQMGAPRLLPTIADPLLRVRPKKFPNESQKSYQQRLMENVHNAAKRGKLGTSA